MQGLRRGWCGQSRWRGAVLEVPCPPKSARFLFCCRAWHAGKNGFAVRWLTRIPGDRLQVSSKESKMDSFTPVPAAIGGALIGLSAAILWLGNGRIAGISGIFGQLLPPAQHSRLAARLPRLSGRWARSSPPTSFPDWRRRPAGKPAALVERPHGPVRARRSGSSSSGLLTGFGTKIGNGCTSGHGVCGLARLSHAIVRGGRHVLRRRHHHRHADGDRLMNRSLNLPYLAVAADRGADVRRRPLRLADGQSAEGAALPRFRRHPVRRLGPEPGVRHAGRGRS